MAGFKHLIECHCVLAIYRNSEKIVYHKFPVYSKFTSDGKVIEKLVKCNNCDAVHKVTEICKSEIKPGKDQSSVILSKEDLMYSLDSRITNFLEKIDADISVWEHVLDVIEENRWGEKIVIKRDIIDSIEHVKFMTITGENKFKISSDVIKDLII